MGWASLAPFFAGSRNPARKASGFDVVNPPTSVPAERSLVHFRAGKNDRGVDRRRR
jgi:hypothetical protein